MFNPCIEHCYKKEYNIIQINAIILANMQEQ